MDYAASLHYLNSFLNLERIVFQKNNRLWNLDRMRLLLDRFGHPEKSFFPILIAGTKGKGSTGFFLESILKASGIPVGFYCSPHLEDPRERIRLQGKIISKDLWVKTVKTIKQKLQRIRLPARYGQFTYFEIMTLMAMLLFQSQKVGIGIFEVGMGGRLDATNTLDAPLVILTPIHLDHEAFLGHTIAKIAREKAAIIRPLADGVVSPQSKEALQVIQKKIKEKKARFWPARSVSASQIRLLGDFQRTNAGAARQASAILQARYRFPISEASIQTGLRFSGWPGRMEIFGKKGRRFLLDGAHNPASVSALARNLKKMPLKNPVLIFGTSRDKKSDLMLRDLSSLFSTVILTRTPNPRSQEIGRLLDEARGHFSRILPAAGISKALELARALTSQGDWVVLTGSFYLIGEARKILKEV